MASSLLRKASSELTDDERFGLNDGLDAEGKPEKTVKAVIKELDRQDDQSVPTAPVEAELPPPKAILDELTEAERFEEKAKKKRLEDEANINISSGIGAYRQDKERPYVLVDAVELLHLSASNASNVRVKDFTEAAPEKENPESAQPGPSAESKQAISSDKVNAFRSRIDVFVADIAEIKDTLSTSTGSLTVDDLNVQLEKLKLVADRLDALVADAEKAYPGTVVAQKLRASQAYLSKATRSLEQSLDPTPDSNVVSGVDLTTNNSQQSADISDFTSS